MLSLTATDSIITMNKHLRKSYIRKGVMRMIPEDGYLVSELLSLVGLLIFLKASIHRGLFFGAVVFGADILLKIYCLILVMSQTL